MKIYLEWADFKNHISEKAYLRYVDRDLFYLIQYGDFETSIMKDNAAEFEASYKPFANGLSIPRTESASPFSATGGFFARFTGMEGVAAFGTNTNIDYVLTEERWINGVRIIAKGAAWGDYLKFQVIHPTYGVLNEFGTKWYIDADNAKQGDVVVPYPAKIPAGLTIRLLYTSVGTVDVNVYANLYLHKKA